VATVLRTSPLRVLDNRDLPVVHEVLAREPVQNVFVASRVEAAGLDTWQLGAEVWGHVVDGQIDALCYSGANLVPIGAGPAAIRAFADQARRRGRHCSSIVGPAAAVAPLWEQLRGNWGRPRDVRPCQPLLATSVPPAIPVDPRVRRVRPAELDILLPACIAMYTEEVGVSPVARDAGTLYRLRVSELIASGRAFARIENGQVVFKAEIAAATRTACQVQGVWVAPPLRGTGLGIAGTAAVVATALREVAPLVSLYVNDYNAPARAAYRRVGFVEIDSFMSVLF
jgi:predicted GNAT family acetyltransferase